MPASVTPPTSATSDITVTYRPNPSTPRWRTMIEAAASDTRTPLAYPSTRTAPPRIAAWACGPGSGSGATALPRWYDGCSLICTLLGSAPRAQHDSPAPRLPGARIDGEQTSIGPRTAA